MPNAFSALMRPVDSPITVVAAIAVGLFAAAAVTCVAPLYLREEPLSRDVPADVSATLGRGYILAQESLAQLPPCAALFASTPYQGSQVLRFTLYVGAPATHPLCAQDAIAFTRVSSSVVWLCPCFATRPAEAAAVTLIHEGLHSAGVDHPPGRDASVAFSEHIADVCSLHPLLPASFPENINGVRIEQP